MHEKEVVLAGSQDSILTEAGLAKGCVQHPLAKSSCCETIVKRPKTSISIAAE